MTVNSRAGVARLDSAEGLRKRRRNREGLWLGTPPYSWAETLATVCWFETFFTSFLFHHIKGVVSLGRLRQAQSIKPGSTCLPLPGSKLRLDLQNKKLLGSSGSTAVFCRTAKVVGILSTATLPLVPKVLFRQVVGNLVSYEKFADW
jgi:hypothetical protein